MTTHSLGNSLETTGYRVYKLHHVKGIYSKNLVSWIDKHCIVCGRFLPFKRRMYCEKHGEIRKLESRKRSRVKHRLQLNTYRRNYNANHKEELRAYRRELYRRHHPFLPLTYSMQLSV